MLGRLAFQKLYTFAFPARRTLVFSASSHISVESQSPSARRDERPTPNSQTCQYVLYFERTRQVSNAVLRPDRLDRIYSCNYSALCPLFTLHRHHHITLTESTPP